ncbi:MAG: hypothetical protein ACE5G0_02610 [Rhodothermales bacterium]
MSAFEQPCTQPERWNQPPPADAPDAEVLAYLRHCDVCAYHARQRREEEYSLDLLLPEASRDLDMGEVVPPISVEWPTPRQPPRPANRHDRPPTAPPGLREGLRFEKRLALACLLAFGIVILWVGWTTSPWEDWTFTNPQAQVDVEPGTNVPPLSGRLVDAIPEGRLYVAHVMGGALLAHSMNRDVLQDSTLIAAVPRLTPGSLLRVINPAKGTVVIVTVVDRRPDLGNIFLSPAAADALGVEGGVLVFVEVLSEPPPTAIGP